MSGHAVSESPTCEACDLPAGHAGRHEATFKLRDASPGWTGSPEQWSEWNRRVAEGTAVQIIVHDPAPLPPQ